ncbi:Menaquinone reductase, iron-sulfur cluster-binding subunit [Candidatus Calditenuaceae archaeon HR02]|nr:Menaquinone reductase, iron-sulfur cluster-binding subunit [Candidatus Calditenuaceae archaeon HR02]
MVRWGMAIDLDKCTACQACVVACKAENNVPIGSEADQLNGRQIAWMDLVVKDVEGGTVMLPRPCMHCDNPPCVQVCPVGATYQRGDGIVTQDYSRCIGCRLCMVACPYGVRYFNWREPSWPDTFTEYLNPSVPVRPAGVVEKCTFCVHRIERLRNDISTGNIPPAVAKAVRGEADMEKKMSKAIDTLMRRLVTKSDEVDEAEPEEMWSDFDFRELNYLPSCVRSCTGRAIIFGDLEDPESLVSQMARSKRAFRLFEEFGTEPKVIYLQEGR